MAVTWSVSSSAFGDLVGKLLNLGNNIESFRIGEVANPAQEKGKERDDGELGSERLGCSHADLRPRMHIHSSVALSRDGACDIVANSKGPMTFPLAFAQGRKGVRRLSALADDEDERVTRHRQVSVTQFACEFAFDGNVGQGLDKILADHRRHGRRSRSRSRRFARSGEARRWSFPVRPVWL